MRATTRLLGFLGLVGLVACQSTAPVSEPQRPSVDLPLKLDRLGVESLEGAKVGYRMKLSLLSDRFGPFFSAHGSGPLEQPIELIPEEYVPWLVTRSEPGSRPDMDSELYAEDFQDFPELWTERTFSLVAETRESWFLEVEDSRKLEGRILGLQVAKSDHSIERAILGRRGEAGVELLPPGATIPATDRAQASQWAVMDTCAGRVSAAKLDRGGPLGLENTDVWRAVSGELAGIDVAYRYEVIKPGIYRIYSAHYPRYPMLETKVEIAGPPRPGVLKIGETEVPALEVEYSDRSRRWYSDHPVIACFKRQKGSERGLAQARSSSGSFEVIELGTDARPQLIW